MGQYQSQEMQISQEEIKLLFARFKRWDTNGDGELEYAEFQKVPELKQNPLVERVFKIFDKDNSGSISFEEFLNGLSMLYGTDEEKKLKFAFKIYDIDGDGFISNGELYHVLKMMVGANLEEKQLQQLVDRTIIKADEDFDGKISFTEFKKMVKDLGISDKLQLPQITSLQQ